MVSIRGTRILKDGGVSISTYEHTVESRYDGKKIITFLQNIRKQTHGALTLLHLSIG